LQAREALVDLIPSNFDDIHFEQYPLAPTSPAAPKWISRDVSKVWPLKDCPKLISTFRPGVSGMMVEANGISPSPTSHYATMSSSMILRHKVEGVIEDPELWLALKKLFVQISLEQSTHNHASGCTFLDKLPRELRSEIYNASSNSFILLNLLSSTYILPFLHVDRYMKKLREFCMATTHLSSTA
jgi:hypothetical protein